MESFSELLQQAFDSLATADESWTDATKQVRDWVNEHCSSNDAKHRYEQVRTGESESFDFDLLPPGL